MVNACFHAIWNQARRWESGGSVDPTLFRLGVKKFDPRLRTLCRDLDLIFLASAWNPSEVINIFRLRRHGGHSYSAAR
jgi:hypothetical protein